MRRPTNAKRRAGVTLLELMISLTILAVVIGALSAATLSAQSAFKLTAARSELEYDARRTVDRIAEELRTAGSAGLSPEPLAPLGSSSLQFQRNGGWIDGAIDWSLPLQISLEEAPEDPANGVDDDGDGMIDDRRVVWTRDAGQESEVATTWMRGVPRFAEGELANGLDDNGNGLVDEAGLSFELDGNALYIRLTLQRGASGGAVLVRSVETAVILRN